MAKACPCWLSISKEDRCVRVATAKPRISASSVCPIVHSVIVLYTLIQLNKRLYRQNYWLGAGHSNSCPISSSIAAYSVKTQFSSIIIIVYTVVACIDRSLGAYI